MFINEDGLEKIGARFVMDRIQTQTPYGNKAKRAMRVFGRQQIQALQQELDLVDQLMNLIGKHRYTFVEIRNQFKRIKDLSGSFERIKAQEVLSVPELFEIKSLVLAMGEISSALGSMRWSVPDRINVKRLAEVEALLDPEKSGVNTFYLYDAYSEALTAIRREIKGLDESIRRRQKEKRLQLEDDLGVRIRPNGEVTVSKENKALLERLNQHPELAYSSETYMNMTFRIREDDAVDRLISEKELMIQKEDEESHNVRADLTRELGAHLESLQRNIQAIGDLDLLVAKSYFGVGHGCVKPEVTDEAVLMIENGRHPAVEERLKREQKAYKPVSVSIREGATCITGANMGGKTVTLKMIGLSVWMAQMGIFVPAERMIWSPRDFVFVSIGDEQNVDLGLSTFGAEIVKVSQAVELSEETGLILIDELARGTNPKEGYAISRALINRLKTKTSMTVITTHFDGLADEPDVLHLQVRGLEHVDFSSLKSEIEDPSVGMALLHEYMDYRLKEIHRVEEVPKDAVHIAKLMGLHSEILEDARQILGDMTRNEN